jgi:hypothetical protein
MNTAYEVAIINPKTGAERKILAELSIEQVEAAKASPCFQRFVQSLVRANIPAGFMPLGNGVKPVTLQ